MRAAFSSWTLARHCRPPLRGGRQQNRWQDNYLSYLELQLHIVGRLLEKALGGPSAINNRSNLLLRPALEALPIKELRNLRSRFSFFKKEMATALPVRGDIPRVRPDHQPTIQ